MLLSIDKVGLLMLFHIVDIHLDIFNIMEQYNTDKCPIISNVFKCRLSSDLTLAYFQLLLCNQNEEFFQEIHIIFIPFININILNLYIFHELCTLHYF